MANRIEEAQFDLLKRRTSCHKYRANQLRLLLTGLRARDAYGIYASLKQHVPVTSGSLRLGIVANQEDLDSREVVKQRRAEMSAPSPLRSRL